MPGWDEDSPQLQDNLKIVLSKIVLDTNSRIAPSIDLARHWQRLIMSGLRVENSAYVGTYRGERGLEYVGVRIGEGPGAAAGVAPGHVAKALTGFESTLRSRIALLDGRIPIGEQLSVDGLNSIIELCAWAHAEWIRIHPFANGNGRTARLWANWIALRYGLPPFITLRPRPGDGYGMAGAEAMRGNFVPTVAVFRQLLKRHLST